MNLSEFIKELWENYSKQHTYAEKIKYSQIIIVIKKIEQLIKCGDKE